MSAPQRAIRFAGAGSLEAGPVTTTTGALATVRGDEAVRQAIILLLGTRPGERLMRPRYGSYLHRLLFAPNDHTTAGLAIHYVRQAIERWEARVDILELDAGADPDVATRLNITLRYRVRASLTVDSLIYPLDLGSTPPEVPDDPARA